VTRKPEAVTAETITDEQIEDLRSVSESGEGYVDAVGEYIPTTAVLEWCDDALSDPETEPKAFARIRCNARARLAEIWNARRAVRS
jgi:hypothetical protein